MKYLCKIYLFLLLIYSSFKKVKLDLPVHCLSAKIEGVWIFYLGDNIHDKDLKCGHKRPDQNLDHYNVEVDKVFKHKYEFIVRIERPDKVYSIKDNKQVGKWTMIYDEGFEFTIFDQVFFAFNRYKKVGRFSASNTDTEETKGYVNICNKTFLGWYHNKSTIKQWGCYWGEQIENNKLRNLDIDRINYKNIFKLNKIPFKFSGRKKNIQSNEFINDDVKNDLNGENNKINDLTSLKNEFLKSSKLKKSNSNSGKLNDNDNREFNTQMEDRNKRNFPTKNSKSQKVEILKSKNKENEEDGSFSDNNNDQSNNSNNYSYVDFLKSLRSESSKSKYNNIPHLDIYFLNNDSENDGNNERNNNFLEVNASTKLFQPDYDYVNRINDPKNKYHWTAKIHEDFIGKSYSQMRNLLGNVNFMKSPFFENETENIKGNSGFNISVNNIENGKLSKTEKEKLISSSKNDIQNYLENSSLLEFNIDVDTTSFLNTEVSSELLTNTENLSLNKSKNRKSLSRNESEMELDSEENDYNYDGKNGKYNKNSKRKNENKKSNLDQNSDSFNENVSNEEGENEIDIELSEDVASKEDPSKQQGIYGKLPQKFDWRNVDGTNYDSPVRKQGECGSCYAIAAVSVMECRIRIKSNNRLKPILSPSSILACSRYNQGCFGGYPYLVGKFGRENGFVEESCQPYTETDDKCFDFCFHEKNWKVKNYG